MLAEARHLFANWQAGTAHFACDGWRRVEVNGAVFAAAAS